MNPEPAPVYVAGFAFGYNNVVWLVHKDRGPVRGWNGIGGKVEPFETPQSAMRREWKEETGSARPIDPLHFCTLHTNVGSRIFFFTFEHLTLDLNPFSDVGETIRAQNYRYVPGCVPNLHWLLPMAHEALYNKGHGEPFIVAESPA